MLNTQSEKKTNIAAISVVSNTLLVLMKMVIGMVTGSVSIISEAIHSAVDLVAAAIAFTAVKMSGKEADRDHPFGHGKFENLSGTIEAMLIFLAAGWIIYEAVHKLIRPQPFEMIGWGAAVMFVSSAVNWVVSSKLFKIAKETESIALEADALHLRVDVYTSLGVMFGLICILIINKVLPGVNVDWIDPVTAIIVALMIIKAAYDLTVESGKDLLDVSLPEADNQWIKDYIEGYPGSIVKCARLRTRKAGSNRFIEVVIIVDADMKTSDSHAIADYIESGIKAHIPKSDVMIHVETQQRDNIA